MKNLTTSRFSLDAVLAIVRNLLELSSLSNITQFELSLIGIIHLCLNYMHHDSINHLPLRFVFLRRIHQGVFCHYERYSLIRDPDLIWWSVRCKSEIGKAVVPSVLLLYVPLVCIIQGSTRESTSLELCKWDFPQNRNIIHSPIPIAQSY